MYYRDEALTTLDLSCEDTGGSTDETFLSYSRRWVDLVNRGGLCVVSDEVYTAFQATELAIQEYLQRGTIGKYKDDAVEYVTSDGDVQFHWCCLMSTVIEECAQELLKVLVQLLVTVGSR